MTGSSLHSATPLALRSLPELPADQAQDLISRLARQVMQLHASGRIHANLTPEGVLVDENGHPVTGDIPAVRSLTRAMREWLPPDLRPLLPLDLPTDVESAVELLQGTRSNVHPRDIDIHQLANLACRLIAVDSADAYLRSPRVKGRVPQDWQSVIDAALGSDGHRRPASAEEIVRLLEKHSASTEPIPAEVAVADTADSDTTPSIAGRVKAGDTVIRRAGHNGHGDSDSAELQFQKLGHYEVVGWIGHGGMGDVYRGYERALDRTVALKVLPADLSSEPEFVRRFYAEASAAARVIHPHVIQIHFIGEDSGRHFFAMQYVEGESLAALLARRGRLSVEETLEILEQVLAGLGAAHRQGLIHRDVKPGNILLDQIHRRAVLADFGLVKSLAAMEGRTATGVVMGTVDYIAPEQGRGLPVDHRCDLYAVGVLAYQLLSGRLPFSADSPTAMIFQHAYEPAPPLTNVVAEVPAVLAAVVAKLMAKSREMRHASAEGALADIQAIRSGRPLPSGADVELAANPRAFLVVNPIIDRNATTLVIHAPQFSDEAWLPEKLPPEAVSTWWGRFREWCSEWLRSRTPEWVDKLQSTQQQVGGAVAEYERRRNQLRGLVGEAEDVLKELRSALATRGDDADLQRAVADQEEQLGEMRLRQSQVEATLRQLCHQRDLLQARLKAAHAKLHLSGKSVANEQRTQSRRWFRLRMAVLASVGIPLCLLAFRDAALIKQSFVSLFTSTRATPAVVPPAAASSTRNQRFQPIVPELAEWRTAVASRANVFVTSLFDPSRMRSGSLASGQAGVEIKLWDLESGTETLSVEKPHRTYGMAISPSGEFLVSAGRDASTGVGEIKLWELKTGHLLYQFGEGVPTRGVSVGFSSDSRTAYSLLGASLTQELGIVTIANGRLERQRMPQSTDQATAIAFSPVSDVVAIGIVQTHKGGRSAIDIHDMKPRRMLHSISTTASPYNIAFSDDGKRLVGSLAGTVTVWETNDWTQVVAIPGKVSSHNRIVVSPDGTYVAASHSLGIDLVDISGRLVRPLTVRSMDLGFTSGGTLMVVPENGRMMYFDPATGKEQLAPKLRKTI